MGGLAAVAAAAAALSMGAIFGAAAADNKAVRIALQTPGAAFMEQAYEARGFKPIWIHGRRPTAGTEELIADLEASGRDGLNPSAYSPQVLRERIADLRESSDPERIKTELMLSWVYAHYIHDLHTPAPASDVVYTDAAFQPPFRKPAAIMDQLAKAASPRAAMLQSTAMNPLYAQLRAVLDQPAGPGAPARAILLKNLDRLRALPAQLGQRFVLVDAVSSRLWLYENGKPVDSMKVIVGAKAEQTPQLAGLIRYAIFNPYWNVPPDLTQKTYAPRILAKRSALDDLHMDAWSDFTPNAKVVDPGKVDWTAVAEGRTVGWLRQRPGPGNSMGAVKFMLPNTLGIYLHDTPEKALFARDQRDFSAGCVRVEDYRRLARWLYRGADVGPRGDAPEQHIDLPAPVPVYILYLTVPPRDLGGGAYRDPYGRDQA